MWPSEGSVCQAMIPLLARHGIQWIATDEEILGCSTHGKVGRDSRGHVRHPELLYRPWKVAEGGHELGDRLPRPLDVRPGRLPLSAQPGPGRRGRLPRQAPRDRRRLPPEPGDARPRDPRRRELLGVLPRRRRLVPPLALPGRGARPAGPAGHGRRVPPRAPADRHAAPALRRKLDQPQLRDLDRPPRRQPRLGRAARDPAVPGRSETQAGRARPEHRSRGPGTRSTSPRAPTGSGGTATITRAPSTRCSTTCSASTCGTSTRCSAHDPPGVAVHADLAGGAATGRSTTSRTAS